MASRHGSGNTSPIESLPHFLLEQPAKEPEHVLPGIRDRTNVFLEEYGKLTYEITDGISAQHDV